MDPDEALRQLRAAFDEGDIGGADLPGAEPDRCVGNLPTPSRPRGDPVNRYTDLRWKQCVGHYASGNRCKQFVHLPADAPTTLQWCERHKPKPTPIEETS